MFENPPPTLSPTSLPDGTYGASYPSQTITATEAGYSGSFTYATQNVNLPPNMSLAIQSNGVVLSGTPTSTGSSFSFTVTATDSDNVTGSQTYTLTIGKDGTTTTGTLSAASLSFGQPLTVTAIVTANAPGSGTPTGMVDFYDTTTGVDLSIPPIALTNGTATLTVADLPVGNNTIMLSYSGDDNFLASSTTTTVTVNQSILVLDSMANGALTLSGNARISIAGTVVVDSNSSSALTASGNAVLQAGSIEVVGKVQKTGNATLSPAPGTARLCCRTRWRVSLDRARPG